jgi:hypothetical protein
MVKDANIVRLKLEAVEHSSTPDFGLVTMGTVRRY